MKKNVTVPLLLAFALPLLAQAPPATQREHMKKLDFMIGRWKGEGWIDRDGQRRTFAGTETVQGKLGGIALLVEGLFKGKVAGQDEEVTVHETLAVISYDEKANTYRFRTYLASGQSGDHELQLDENGWRWGMKYPQAELRYTFKLTGKGEWFEIGEFSPDGQSWRQFFEMTLRRD
jgi:hypothetical protein